jgi:hypothetical protein
MSRNTVFDRPPPPHAQTTVVVDGMLLMAVCALHTMALVTTFLVVWLTRGH